MSGGARQHESPALPGQRRRPAGDPDEASPSRAGLVRPKPEKGRGQAQQLRDRVQPMPRQRRDPAGHSRPSRAGFTFCTQVSRKIAAKHSRDIWGASTPAPPGGLGEAEHGLCTGATCGPHAVSRILAPFRGRTEISRQRSARLWFRAGTCGDRGETSASRPISSWTARRPSPVRRAQRPSSCKSVTHGHGGADA